MNPAANRPPKNDGPAGEITRLERTRPEAPNKADTNTNKAVEWTKAIGMPLVTLLVTVFGGYLLTDLAKQREARESDERLYAQLLTQREQSDALIRKDMFGVVIKEFLKDARQDKPSDSMEDWSNKVLQLELLAYNFNQSLDLAPLFKDLATKLTNNTGLPGKQVTELQKRLDTTAADLIIKQVNSLARRGFATSAQVPLGGWQQSFGKPFIDETIPKSRLVPSPGPTPVGVEEQIHFAVEIVDVDLDRHEVEIRLRVDFSSPKDTDVDRHFWVGQYDFPMLDNTELSSGLRVSVVITEFFVPEENREENSFAKIYLVVFPGASASFKERQDYDDILLDMLRARGRPLLQQGDRP